MKYQDTLMYREITEQPKAILDCKKANGSMIASLAEAINKYKPASIVLAGRGTSDHAGVYFKYLSEILWGIPVSLAAPSVVSTYRGKLCLEKTLVIGVSQSGQAQDVNEILARGNECGAMTVAITNNPSSLLAKAAKYHLFCACGEERSVAATKTFTAQCYLLASLVGAVTKNKELLEALETVSSVISDSLKLEQQIVEASSRFTKDESCFVLGRGLNYGVVLESSLKLQETTYIKAKSYASSDFHHGPFAQIDKGTKVIISIHNDESARDNLEMLSKLQSVGADVTVITNEPSASGTVTIRYSKGVNRYISTFAYAPIIQLFACSLSVARGLNPDAPRGLKKITITK